MPSIPIAAAVLPRLGVRSYGYQREPTSAHPAGHTHNGVDLPAPIGTPVRAAHAGVVTHATRRWEQGFTGYGNVIVVDHEDGTWALYAHLNQPYVKAGDRIEEGATIGEVGNTQYNAPDHVSVIAGGPHLHFELSPRPYPQASNATRLDPVAWFEETDTDPLARRPATTLAQSLSPLSSSAQSAPCSISKGKKHDDT